MKIYNNRYIFSSAEEEDLPYKTKINTFTLSRKRNL